MTATEGELEKKIKRAYSEDAAPSRARKTKERLGVFSTQVVLCVVAFAALACLRFFAPASFEAARVAFEGMWERPEMLALETLSREARGAAAELIALLDAQV